MICGESYRMVPASLPLPTPASLHPSPCAAGSYDALSASECQAAALAIFPEEEPAVEEAGQGMQRRASGGWERVEEMDLGAWEVSRQPPSQLVGSSVSTGLGLGST